MDLPRPGILCYKLDIPSAARRVEFHAEWLRDEPCDATTTGQNKGVPVSTLSWDNPGNMRFGASQAVQACTRISSSLAVRGDSQKERQSQRHTPLSTGDERCGLFLYRVRAALQRVRQELRQPAPLGLPRLPRSPRGALRPRIRPRRLHPREHRRRPREHLALRRAAAHPRRLPARPARRLHAARPARTASASASAPAISTSRTTPSAFPTLSFKDRVVSVALANAQASSASTPSAAPPPATSPTRVAAQAARLGLKACILVPADLEPAKILNTQVYGARLVRIDGNYDHVNRLCTLRSPTSTTGASSTSTSAPTTPRARRPSATRSPSNSAGACPTTSSVPMAGGSLIRKIRKAFNELICLGLVEAKPVQLLRRAGHRLLAHLARPSRREPNDIEPQRPNTIARSLAIGNPADGPAAAKMIRATAAGPRTSPTSKIVAGIQELAETEGIFTETAGGVTTAVTARLYRPGPHRARRDSPSSASPATASRPPTPSPAASPSGARRPPAPRRLRRLPPRARRLARNRELAAAGD